MQTKAPSAATLSNPLGPWIPASLNLSSPSKQIIWEEVLTGIDNSDIFLAYLSLQFSPGSFSIISTLHPKFLR